MQLLGRWKIFVDYVSRFLYLAHLFIAEYLLRYTVGGRIPTYEASKLHNTFF